MAAAEYEKAVALDSKNKTAQTKLTLMRSLLENQTIKPAAAQSINSGPAGNRPQGK